MSSFRSEKIEQLLTHLAATFLQEESSGASLITVTRCILGDRNKRATLFITVLPEIKEPSALDFANRKRQELRNYVQSHSKIGHIPVFEFVIDTGEKARQRISEIDLGLSEKPII